ncbi:hypothetical protein EDB84DRAFT_1499511 [Lactarius hengduanensis]|nr:hypothetical protein EDB84DRAFT_1499511 [Lactarius hengduanensis]KAH9040400.1 hypothetical protein EDB85DRAFT_1925967 [Lactarius pseudohatsudake]
MLLFSLSVLLVQQLWQSVTAKRNDDNRSVELTLVRGARDEEDVQGATYFDVPANRGSHTLMVTPIISIPSQPLWKRLFSLRSS